LVCCEARRGGAAAGWAFMLVAVLLGMAVGGVALYYTLNHGSSAIGIGSPSDNGATGNSSDSQPANFTTLGGQVAVTDAELPAGYFTENGTTSTFACGSSPSGAYLVLTDQNKAGDAVASVTISSFGAETVFTPSGSCDVGSETTYITFPATSQISPSPRSGQSYEGLVSMADGVPVTFQGTWN